MKLASIFLLATFGLSNAALLPREAEAEAEAAPEPAGLQSRQVTTVDPPCTVTGKGGLNGDGVCKYTYQCDGVSVPGHCFGPVNYQCCRQIRCSAPENDEFCLNTYKACPGGSFRAGLCPGSSDIQCCVT